MKPKELFQERPSEGRPGIESKISAGFDLGYQMNCVRLHLCIWHVAELDCSIDVDLTCYLVGRHKDLNLISNTAGDGSLSRRLMPTHKEP